MNRYTLLRKVGKGSYGTVFLATKTSEGEKVLLLLDFYYYSNLFIFRKKIIIA